MELYFRETKTAQGQDQHHKLEQNKFGEGHTTEFSELKNFGRSEFHFTGFRIYDIVFGTQRAQETTSQCSVTKGDIPGYVGLRRYSSGAVVDTTRTSFILRCCKTSQLFVITVF
jgi:hypothetical protein